MSSRIIYPSRFSYPLNLWFILLAVVFVSNIGFVNAQEDGLLRLDDVRSGELLFRTATPDTFRAATQLSTDVTIDVSGMVARVSVVQTFENTGTDWAEAVYVFPLPEDAAVNSLKMRVGERIIEGEIQEKEEAKATYETAKAAGQHTSLVEQERPNMFTTLVANIAPGESIEIAIGYLETLRYEGGQFSLRFPMAITPRYSPGQPLLGETPVLESSQLKVAYEPAASGWAVATTEVSDAPRISPPYRRPDEKLHNPVTLRATIDAGFPLKKLESTYHEVEAVPTEPNSVKLVGPVPAERDFELVWTPDVGAQPGAAVFTETLDGEPYALIMLMPPSVVSKAPALPRDVTLIIDTSGSMEGMSIGQARKSLLLALERLRPTDRFNIIEFNDTARQLFTSSQAANPRYLDQAKRYVRRLSAGGGTEMASALDLAFATHAPEGYLRQIVFVTDGSVGNEAALFNLIERGLGNGRLFTVGIGAAPNSYFMRKAAEFGRGTYTYIGDVAEVGEKMTALFAKLESPVLTGLNLDLPPGAEAYPATVPDLYAGEPVVVSLKLQDANAELKLQGVVGEQNWTRDLSLQGANSEGVGNLWARAKIESLHDEEIRGGDVEVLRDRIVQVALRHSLVTAYTSLVAVDKTPARPANESLNNEDIPQNLPLGGDFDAIFGAQTVGYPNTATSAPMNLLISLLTFALVLLLLARRSALGLLVRAQRLKRVCL